MTERRYTLAEITGALGRALGRLAPTDRLTAERPLNLFLDDVVATLKALPVETRSYESYEWTEVGRDSDGFYQMGLDGIKIRDIASPND